MAACKASLVEPSRLVVSMDSSTVGSCCLRHSTSPAKPPVARMTALRALMAMGVPVEGSLSVTPSLASTPMTRPVSSVMSLVIMTPVSTSMPASSTLSPRAMT